MAVGRNVNNSEMFLTWAIVEMESGASWSWFLKHLILAIPEINAIGTIIFNNQDKGLSSMGHLMLLVSGEWYCQHIAQNVRHCHEGAIEKIFWQLV